MTPEPPTRNPEDADDPHPAQEQESQPGAGQATRAPGALPRELQPLLPSTSGGEHPLPKPWPQPDASLPTLEKNVPLIPSVTPEHWLPEPDYWLSDHQRVPRPPTRPITRPMRFRKASRLRSGLLALVAVLIIGIIGIGMVTAGRLSYQFFNQPQPTAAPTHSAQPTPTLPAK